MCRGGYFDISNREAESGEDLPDGHALPDGLHTLRSANTTDLLIFKTCESIREKSGWPDSVVVSEHDDIRRHVLDAVGHLKPFVGKRYGEDADAFRIDGIRELLKRADHLL